MRVVVAGSRGMLGQELGPCLKRAGFAVLGVDLREQGPAWMDITRWDEVLPRLRSLTPDLVINCAAYTAVDQAESEPEKAFIVNRDGAANLANACGTLAIPMIHLSTDYVFDGRLERPYREDDPANPLNVYGLSKWQGEEAIRSALPAHLIVRTSWLYGVHGHNFVKTILRRAQAHEELRVVADQFGSPTWAGDLSRAMAAMAQRIQQHPQAVRWGTYHFCGRGYTTWHGFAQTIVDEAQRQGRLRLTPVRPITTAEYPGAARRPPWSVLDCQKVGTAFNLTPRPWEQGLRDMITGLFAATDSKAEEI